MSNIFQYRNLSDVPQNVLDFLENVHGLGIVCTTVESVNRELNLLNQYYEENNQFIWDFI